MTRFIWSIDDAGSGGPEMQQAVRQACAIFEAVGVRATWFAVPQAGGQPLTAAWRDTLCEARDRGHDLQLHGLTHADCFEFGPPAWPAVDIVPAFITEFGRRREELRPRYTVAHLQDCLETGIEVFEHDLNVRPVAFRAPCGARSEALYAALRAVGIGYESCVYLSATGYEHLPQRSGSLAPAWRPEVPPTPFRWYSDVVQVPILNEYTWRGAGARSDEFLALARDDVARIAPLTPVAVLLAHTHGLADDFAHAERLIRSVVEQVRGEGLGDFATFAEAIADGTVDAAVAGEHPRDLPC
ncbi:MAG: polysaccharide deacetylase family protein [Fimbriimonadaceae bacterium]|nr:polysaccharide deacetylase family protein [Fimbriimonadaceae bacterium]